MIKSTSSHGLNVLPVLYPHAQIGDLMMIDLPDSMYDAIEEIGLAIWMDAFASGVTTGCGMFLPDQCAVNTANEVVNEAVRRATLVEVVRQSIRDRILEYRCSEGI